MAPQLTDGVPGLEAIHILVPASPWPEVTLNDWMDEGTGLTRALGYGGVSAFTRLQGIQGLRAKPDSDDPRVNLNYQFGETPFPRLMRGKSLTYTGVIVGESMSAMRNHEAQIAAAAINGQANPTASYLSVSYDAAYDANGLEFFGYGNVVDYDCPEALVSGDSLPTPYQRTFTLTFRLRDGRWFEQSQVQSCGYAGSPPTLPGTWGGIPDGSPGTLTMPGTAPSDPVVSMVGEGSSMSATVTITMTELGTQLQLAMPAPIADGDYLIVDYRARSVTYIPGGTGSPVDYSGYIDWPNTSAWSEKSGGSLAVGTNTITVTGGGGWAAYAYPAVW